MDWTLAFGITDYDYVNQNSLKTSSLNPVSDKERAVTSKCVNRLENFHGQYKHLNENSCDIDQVLHKLLSEVVGVEK